MFCQYQPVPWTLVLQYLPYHASQNKYVHKYGFANHCHFVGPYSNLELEITFTIYNFKAMAQILSRRRLWWNAAKLVPAQLCALLVSSQNCWPNFPLNLLSFQRSRMSILASIYQGVFKRSSTFLVAIAFGAIGVWKAFLTLFSEPLHMQHKHKW